MKVLLIATALLAAFTSTDAKCWPVASSCVDGTAGIFISTINNGPDASQSSPFADNFICAFNQHGARWYGDAEEVHSLFQALIDTFGKIFTSPETQAPEDIANNVNEHWSTFQTIVGIVTGDHYDEYVASSVSQDFLSKVVPWKDQLLEWSNDPSTFEANAQAGGEIYRELVAKFVKSLKDFNAGSCAATTADFFIATANADEINADMQKAFAGYFICSFDQAGIQWQGEEGDVASWFEQLIGTFDQMFLQTETDAIVQFLDEHWSSFEKSISAVTGDRLDDYVNSPGAQKFLKQVLAWREQLRSWATEDPATFADNARAGISIYKQLVPRYVQSLKEFLAA